MKRQVRRNVFETNSSSMHSLSIAKEGVTEYLHVDEYTNKVITEFGNFGWGYDEYNDPETKLSYLVTMVGESRNCHSIEEVYETNDFKKINDVVSERCECNGIEIKNNYGYIDHQSIDTIDNLMKEYDCTIEEFIFDNGITLVIDNDD